MLDYLTYARHLECEFTDAKPSEAAYLTQFALDSNAVYNYRVVSDEEARKVFELTPIDFESGVVKVLKMYGQVIGFFSLRKRETFPGWYANELGHLFLDPSFIGQGYGRMLFEKAVEVAKEELGWEMFEFESDPNAASFYLKMGAKIIGKNPCRLNPAFETPIFVALF